MTRARLFVLGPLAAAALFLCGCEAESSADQSLTLSPKNATLRQGQSATFTVSGGYTYKWWLKDERSGSLNTRTGTTVVYTCLSATTNALNQELYVESYIRGSSGGSPTNSVSTNTQTRITETAYITHVL